jgi:CO dehydrogenase maturation factor
MLVVVEPNRTSAETAHRIQKLAADIGIKHVKVVGNKVRGPSDQELIRGACEGLEILGFLPLSEQIRQISTGETTLEQIDGETLAPVRKLVARLS